MCKIFSLSLSLSPPNPPLPAVSSHFDNPVFAEITFKLFAASVLVLMLADVDVARCFGRFFQPYRPDFSFVQIFDVVVLPAGTIVFLVHLQAGVLLISC